MSKNPVKYLAENMDKILFIHYSCQNLTDKNQELSPRITSIAVLFNKGYSLKSFSVHLTAEILHIDRDKIGDRYNEIEKEMLSEFFKFAKEQYEYIWLHWNMRNSNYGFEALEHRYKVLTGEDAYHISEENRHDLYRSIVNKYGRDCVDHPKMKSFMELNAGVHRDFLSGEQEVEAFENGEYIKMHKSTMCKVYWFYIIFQSFLNNKVKTKKFSWNLFLDKIFKHPIVQLMGFIAMIFTIIGGVYLFYSLR
jgi:hypothetical protein